jgi:hypothetical protein
MGHGPWVREGPGRAQTGANLRDVFLLAIVVTIGDNLATGTQRIDMCRGQASQLSLDSRARNPPYPGRARLLQSFAPPRNNETPLRLERRREWRAIRYITAEA